MLKEATVAYYEVLTRKLSVISNKEQEKSLAGESVSRPRREPATSRTQITSVTTWANLPNSSMEETHDVQLRNLRMHKPFIKW
jgi:hypothetical protein